LAQWIGAQDRIKFAKKAKTPPLVMFPTGVTRPQKKKKIFSISTRRLSESVEGLNNCRAQSVSELWIVMELKVWSKKWPLWTLEGKPAYGSGSGSRTLAEIAFSPRWRR